MKTKIMFSDVTISDINLETGSVPNIRQYVQNRDMFKNGYNFKKRLKP